MYTESMDDCLFCKIVAREIPASIRYETAEVLAFDDIHPKAATHILIIPKQHVDRLSAVTEAESDALTQLLPAIANIAQHLNLDGFRVRLNNGQIYGQTVPHLHLHLLSGQGAQGVV